jgi:hypothetical protein
MLKELAEFITPREEKIKIGDQTLVVRELSTAADTASMLDQTDINYKFLVRCVFLETGEPAFDEADIPALKAGSRAKLSPLFVAVNRVNGFDIEAEAKNSSAAPG